MPDQDTFDFDAAFHALEQNIAALSSPRGASVAITTARRRRRTTIGGVVAGLALITGGVVVAQSAVTQDHAVAPGHELPAPALLDGPHLSAATDGWTPPWTAGTERARLKMAQTFGGDCFVVAPGGRSAITALGNSHDDLAVADLSDYGDRTARVQRAWRRVVQQLDGCHGAELVSSFSDPSRAEGRLYRITATEPETAPQYEWIVSTGHGIGTLKIMDQSDPLPSTIVRTVADALLAAVQAPLSYDESTPSIGQTLGSPVISSGDFAGTVTGWDTRWRADGPHLPAPDSPCYTKSWQRASWASQHMSLGSNGRQDLALFHSAGDARTAATSLMSELQGCDGARYLVHRSLKNARSMLAVASGPVVVWVAQHDDTVSVLRVPTGESAPPQRVTTDVGGLMFAAITAFDAESK